MKHYKFKYAALLGCLALGSTLTSCTDWLTLYPMDKIVEENFWEDKKDLESVRNAAYVNMVSTNCLERYMVWGELRADNFDKNPAGSLNQDMQDILNLNIRPSNGYYDWANFYATINYCNKVLEHGPEILEKDLSFSEANWQTMRAEMVALRALNYFYLVRTYGDVPLVFKAINDDTEVEVKAATPQKEILDSLVNQMEYICTTNMPKDFGNTADNKGLITDRAIHTILADIYLWRGALYESVEDKASADLDYQKCSEHCQKVIDIFEEEYQEDQKNGHGGMMGGGNNSQNDQDNPYHLIQHELRNGRLMKNAYDEIFGTGNSSESIFELQFDATNNQNSLVPGYYCQSDGNLAALVATTPVTTKSSAADDANNQALYAATDFRRWSFVQLFNAGKSEAPFAIAKFACENVSVEDLNQTSDAQMGLNYNRRNTGDAHWIFYRLSDVLLMKAEAMCRIGTDLQGAFNLVDQVNRRSNPEATDEQRLTLPGNADALEAMILRERNREFLGEGKRWFDLVRYAIRRGEAEGASEAYQLFKAKFSGTLAKQAENKYSQIIDVMYAPYYESEVKANPLLEQNPVWNDQSTIEKN